MSGHSAALAQKIEGARRQTAECKVSVRRAATVICARQRKPRHPLVLKLEHINDGSALEKDTNKADKRTLHVFGKTSTTRKFVNGWEVLMGQSEVQNYLRSTPSSIVPMRYGGEYKFAGGRLEREETPVDAAKRELEEEFLISLPSSTILRPFAIRQTRPVQNTSFIMYSFLCLESENPWLSDPNLCSLINRRLENRRKKFRELCDAGEFMRLSNAEKEKVSPEVNNVAWLSMKEAVSHSYTSMDSKLTCVNEFQHTEFERIGKKSRDPLFVTMAVLTELDKHENSASAIEATNRFDYVEAEKGAVWLHERTDEAELTSDIESLNIDLAELQSSTKAGNRNRNRSGNSGGLHSNNPIECSKTPGKL